MEEKKCFKVKRFNKIIAYTMTMITIMLGLCFFVKYSINSSFGADNQKIELEAKLEKYINFKISDEDKGTLVQYDVKAIMKDQSEDEQFIPIKQSQIKLELSKIHEKYPYDVKVIAKSTEMTNGKTEEISEDYEYNQETGILIIKASNENENGELINTKKGKDESNDEYIIITYYDTYIEETEERELDIKSETIVILNEDDRIISHEEEFREK